MGHLFAWFSWTTVRVLTLRECFIQLLVRVSSLYSKCRPCGGAGAPSDSERSRK
jgi:hypothetical protein